MSLDDVDGRSLRLAYDDGQQVLVSEQVVPRVHAKFHPLYPGIRKIVLDGGASVLQALDDEAHVVPDPLIQGLENWSQKVAPLTITVEYLDTAGKGRAGLVEGRGGICR